MLLESLNIPLNDRNVHDSTCTVFQSRVYRFENQLFFFCFLWKFSPVPPSSIVPDPGGDRQGLKYIKPHCMGRKKQNKTNTKTQKNKTKQKKQTCYF